MKHLFTKLLAAMLVALLALSPVALMEETEPVDPAPEAVEVDAAEPETSADFGDEDEEDVPETEITLGGEELDAAAFDAMDGSNGNGGIAYDSMTIAQRFYFDEGFQNYFVSRFNRINAQEKMTIDEINSVTEIDLSTYSGKDSIVVVDPLSVFPNLKTLNVRNCANLQYLSAMGTHLTTLDVTGCTQLKQFACFGNDLTSIDVSTCPNLEYFFCTNSPLTALDVTKNPKLNELYLDSDKLSELDISNCPNLLQAVAQAEPKAQDDTVIYRLSDDPYSALQIHKNTNVITTPKVVTPTTPATDTTPATPAAKPTPTISAVKKNQKKTVKDVPGAVYQLDLGGATGKKFKSSKKKVATVDANGLVTFKKPGKTTISFKVGKKTRKVKLTFKDSTIPAKVTLNPVNTAVKAGETATLTPVIPDGTNTTYAWKSSNKKVATVADGVVTFKKAGKVTITCTAKRGKKKAKVTFKVAQQ